MTSLSEDYRRKADELLSLAARETNLNARSRLIDEAAHWHRKALAEAGHASDGFEGRAVGGARGKS